VLLDPVHEEQVTRQRAEATEQLEQAQQQLAVAPLPARLGVFRLLDVQADIVAAHGVGADSLVVDLGARTGR